MSRYLLLLLSVACVPYEEEVLSNIVVGEASIEEVELFGMGVVAGGVSGGGQLVVKDALTGERYEVPVNLSGPTVGGLLDFPSLMFAGQLPLDVPSGTAGNLLFGQYRGSREGIVVLGGAQGLHLENESRVRIDATRGAIGLVQILIAAQWLSVKPDLPQDAPYQTAEDTGSGGTGQ